MNYISHVIKSLEAQSAPLWNAIKHNYEHFVCLLRTYTCIFMNSLNNYQKRKPIWYFELNRKSWLLQSSMIIIKDLNINNNSPQVGPSRTVDWMPRWPLCPWGLWGRVIGWGPSTCRYWCGNLVLAVSSLWINECSNIVNMLIST